MTAPYTQQQSHNETQSGLIKTALKLWVNYGEDFRNALDEYETLCAQKKALDIGGKRLKRDVLSGFPTSEKVPELKFLEIEDKSQAKHFLEQLSNRKLNRLISLIERYVKYNYSFNTLVCWNYDIRWRIAHKGKRCAFGDDPSAIHCKGRPRRTARVAE